MESRLMVKRAHLYNSIFTKMNHDSFDFSRNLMLYGPNYDVLWPKIVSSSKRRKISGFSSKSNGRPYQQQFTYEHGLQNNADLWQHPQHVPPQFFSHYYYDLLACDNGAYASTTSKRDRLKSEDEEEVFFMSGNEIERCSPSRKDSFDVMHETRSRYSYCAFLQNLGVRLDVPQNTIGTALVLCHRFFIRRSHATHDRFVLK